MSIIYFGGTLIECLSTDTKPEKEDGWYLVETDTGAVFYRRNGIWEGASKGIAGVSKSYVDNIASTVGHTHSNKSLLDTYAQLETNLADAVTKKHLNTNDPTVDEKAALAGSSGTPSTSNKFVTNADARNSDARTPIRAISATSATTGTIAVTPGSFDAYTITPSGACTFNATGGSVGQRCTFIITTSGTTSRVLTWGTNFRTVGTLATGTVTAKMFCVSFIYNGTAWIETGRTVVIV